MDPPAPRRRRLVWLRRVGVVGVVLGSGAFLSGGAGLLWLQGDAGNRWLLGQILPIVQGQLAEGTIEVGSLDTNLVGRLVLEDVHIKDGDGHEVIGADRLAVRYGLWSLLGGTVHVRGVQADGLVLDVTTDEDGLTSFSRLFGPPDPNAPEAGPWEGLPVDIVVDALRVRHARVRWATATSAYGADHIAIDGAASLVGKRVQVDRLEIGADLTDPKQGAVRLGAAALAWDGDRAEIGGLHAEAFDSSLRAGGSIVGLAGDPAVDVSALLLPVDLGAVDALIGDAGLGGRWQGPVWAHGPFSGLVAHVGLEGIDGSVGRLVVDAKADVEAEAIPWSATVVATDLHAHQAYTPLATMVKALGDEVIANGRIEATGSGTSWPDGIVVKADWTGGPQRVFGMDFDHVDATVGLAGGVLTVPSLGTTGPMGDLVASGSIDLARGPLDLRLKGTAVASELDRFGADGFGGTAWVDARFTGDPRAPRPVYTTTAQIVANDLSYGPEITVSHADADVNVRIDDRAVVVTADVVAGAGEAYGVAFDAAHEPKLVVDYQLTGGDLSVGGEGVVEGADMPGVVHLARAEGPWSFQKPRGADGAFATHLDLGAFEIVDTLRGDSGTADVTFAGNRVGWTVALADGERAVIDTVGALTTDDSRIVLDRLSLSPAQGFRYEATRPVRMTLTDGGIADADVAIAGGPGETLSVQGDLGTKGPLDARIDVDGFDLGVVAALFPESAAAVSGKTSLHADLRGTADQVEMKGDLAFEGTVVEGQERPLGVEASFDGGNDVVALTMTSRVGDEPFIDASGTVPVRLDLSAPGVDPDGTIDFVADLRPGLLERAQEFSEGVPSGKASGRVEVHGPVRDPRIDLAAVAEAPIEGWEAPVRLEIGATREAGVTTVWGDVYEGYDRRGAIDGNADDELQQWLAWALGEGEKPEGDYSAFAKSMHVEADLLGFPVKSLLALSGQDLDADGRIDGKVSVSGSPDTPVVQSDLEWVDGHLGEVTVEHGEVTIEPTENGYTVSANLQTPEGGLNVGGAVPIYVDLRKDPRSWGTGDLDVKIQADSLPLEVVAAFAPDVSDATGTIDMKGVVEGPAIDPRPSMDLSIVDGALSILSLGVRYEQINLDASASRDAIDVRSLTLDTQPIRGGGLSRGAIVGRESEQPALDLSGRIGIADWAPTTVDADVTLDRFYAIAIPDQLLSVNGHVTTSGTWPAVAVRGDVTVESGFWRLDAASFLSEAPLELDQRMVVHRGGQSYGTQAEEVPPFWHQFDVAVDVAMTRNMELNVLFPFLTSYGTVGAFLTTANVVARMSGDLDFTMRGGKFDLRGKVEVIEGKVTVLRSNFDLEQGFVTFQGEPSNPFLDLKARMTVESTSYVEMGVRGLVSEPKIDLTSPDYPSDSQILAILITGKPPDELTASQGIDMTQAMTNLLLTSVLGGARMGTVTVDADGTIRVGLPLGRVYAEAVYRIDPEIDENHYAVDYEIQLARRLLLDGTVGDREVILDLMWELRF